MKPLSIRIKLYLAFLSVLLIMGILITASFAAVTKLEAANEHNVFTYQVIREIDGLQEAILKIQSGQRGYLLTGRDSYLEPLKRGETEYQAHLSKLQDIARHSSVIQGYLAELSQIHQDWMNTTIRKTLADRSAMAGSTTLDTMTEHVLKAQGKAKTDAMRALLDKMIAEEEPRRVERQEIAQADKQTVRWVMIGGGVLAVLLGLGLATWLSNSISSRLKRTARYAHEISAGDLTVRIEQDGSDEIGLLTQAFATMQTNLRRMMTDIHAASTSVKQAADEISAHNGQIVQSSSVQSQAAASMAAAVEQMTVSIAQVSENANQAQTSSQAAGKLSASSGDVISETVSGIQHIASAVGQAAAQISELERDTQAISSVIQVIRDVAEQTNLLALNAAIEAARAGESGRGFAVVADEVRKLAERTAASTAEISEMINRVQTRTRTVVGQMDKEVVLVQQGVEQANAAGDAIVRLHESASEVMRMVNDISIALQEQSKASNSIASNVESIACMAEENATSMQNAQSVTQQLGQVAGQLETAVRRFRT